MILPFKLFDLKQSDLPTPTSGKDLVTVADLVRKHEESVLAFCVDVSKDILPMFGEGRRMTDSTVFDRAALGLARPLSLVLRHVDFQDANTTAFGTRQERVKKLLLRGAQRLAMRDSAFLPPMLELVIASSYGLAYPGGVDIYTLLPDCYVVPGRGGDAAGFARIVDNMDMYWNDTMEGIGRASMIGALDNRREKLSPADKSYLELLETEAKGKEFAHYRRLAVRRCMEWRRAEGDASPSWVRFSKYWQAAREAVQIPNVKE